MLPYIADADVGSPKSLHSLFDKYLGHMLVKFEQIVWSKVYKILSFLTKNGLPFWQSIDHLSSFSVPNMTVVRYV